MFLKLEILVQFSHMRKQSLKYLKILKRFALDISYSGEILEVLKFLC